jgi:hypothetical protein
MMLVVIITIASIMPLRMIVAKMAPVVGVIGVSLRAEAKQNDSPEAS